MPLTCWIPVPSEVYWAREWAEDAVPMLYRHEGVAYTGRIVGQRHDRTREQYWLWFIGEVATGVDVGEGFALELRRPAWAEQAQRSVRPGRPTRLGPSTAQPGEVELGDGGRHGGYVSGSCAPFSTTSP